jgi:hypothetical protein
LGGDGVPVQVDEIVVAVGQRQEEDRLRLEVGHEEPDGVGHHRLDGPGLLVAINLVEQQRPGDHQLVQRPPAGQQDALDEVQRLAAGNPSRDL